MSEITEHEQRILAATQDLGNALQALSNNVQTLDRRDLALTAKLRQYGTLDRMKAIGDALAVLGPELAALFHSFGP